MKTIVAGCTVAAVLTVAGLAGAQVSARPSLVLVGENPLVLRGNGFKANERVTVFVQAGETWTRKADASLSGSFALRLPVAVPACGGVSAHAFGTRGSRARLLRLVRRGCWGGSLPDR